jgi:hypothetical protein
MSRGMVWWMCASLLACSSLETQDGAAASDAGGDAVHRPAGFGAVCPADGKCLEDMVCYTYGDGIKRCTLPCTSDAQCPVGATGTGCNGKGYCRP